MPPRIPCPNCQQNEWLENTELNYFPRVTKLRSEKYVADPENGIHVKVWRCDNCMYLMHFWEPD